jgi:(E)-4-hydroxy-3-methylbut-2-enyl-diphosphate synthase
MIDNGDKRPAIVKFHYDDADYETVAIKAAIDFGTIIMNGFRDGIWIDAPQLSAEQISRLSLNILQATRQRFTKTEYIACPGCGRTLFDLRTTLAEIKKATSHLKGLKIGVMGCIVNGPGEMADADYGYVGAAAGNISLYKGKTCVAKNIPAGEAIEHLIAILRENGDWVEP